MDRRLDRRRFFFSFAPFFSFWDELDLDSRSDSCIGIARLRSRMEGRMLNSKEDGQKNSGVFQMFLGFGGAIFKFLKKIGVVRTGGLVDTIDD